MCALTQLPEKEWFGCSVLYGAGGSGQKTVWTRDREVTALSLPRRVAGPRLCPAVSQRDVGSELQRELRLRQRGGLQPRRWLLLLHPGLAGGHL